MHGNSTNKSPGMQLAPNSTTKHKRDDLQGIRGIAILAVLGFHFYPQYFPNGYFGVDQFFVLSGFLMTMIVTSKNITRETIFQFYYRRIKRILPLYAFIVLVVLIGVILLAPHIFVQLNADSSLRAITFTSNIITRSANHDYFIMLEQAEDVFTHTWSLSVEIQFYLFVPLIFGTYQFISSKGFILEAHILLCINAALSLTYHILAPENIAFNSVFARYWQFYVGIESYFLSEMIMGKDSRNIEAAINLEDLPFLENISEEEQSDTENANTVNFKKEHKLQEKCSTTKSCMLHVQYGFFLLLLLTISFLPMQISSLQARVLSTISTGLIILTGTFYSAKNILANRLLVLIGDISYSLYLIHWPIVVLIKFSYPDAKYATFIGMFSSILLAYCIYRTYESWYLRLEKMQISILIATLYGLILALALNTENIEKLLEGNQTRIDHTQLQNISKDEAIRINAQWAKDEYKNLIIPNCYPNITEHGFCSFSTNKKGKYRILILGNSYAANLGQLIYTSFGAIAKNMSKFSHSYCEVLVVDHKVKGCVEYENVYLNKATQFQPDILFIVAKSALLNSPLEADVTKDKIYLEAYDKLLKYENITKTHVFIVDTIPVPTTGFLTKLNDKLLKNATIKNSDFTSNQNHTNGIRRNDELGKRCSKCSILKLGGAFFAKKPYDDPQFFEPSTFLGYFYNGQHITPAGQELLNPILYNESEHFTNTYIHIK